MKELNGVEAENASLRWFHDDVVYKIMALETNAVSALKVATEST